METFGNLSSFRYFSIKTQSKLNNTGLCVGKIDNYDGNNIIFDIKI